MGTCRSFLSLYSCEKTELACHVAVQPVLRERPTGNLVKCQNTQCDTVIQSKGCCIGENSLPANGGVQSTCNVSKTGVDIVQCSQ
jgi:hypothetical protein